MIIVLPNQKINSKTKVSFRDLLSGVCYRLLVMSFRASWVALLGAFCFILTYIKSSANKSTKLVHSYRFTDSRVIIVKIMFIVSPLIRIAIL